MTTSVGRNLLPMILACTAAAWPAGAELLKPVDRESPPPASVDEWTVRSRPVEVDLAVLASAAAGDSVELTLFDDARLGVEIERVESTRPGSRTWVGHVAGRRSERVFLAARRGVLAGSVRQGGRMFRIVYRGDGVHAVEEVDEAAMPEEEAPLVPPEPTEPTAPEGSDPADSFDLMVVYTPAARAGAGGTAAIEALIDLGISETNESYSVTGIDLAVRLAHTEEVAYTESGSLSTDLSRLRGTTDGFIDEVHDLRDTYGADITMLIVNSGGCGIAYIMTVVDPSFESSAFNVVARGCVSPNYTFAHEMGHNQSARHDWFVDGTNNSPFTFNHGYVHPGDQWRTIMAYSNDCGGCTRELFWSNPDRNHPVTGDPTGVPDGQPQAADNRMTLTQTAPTVANFRPRATTIFTDGFEAGDTSAWDSTVD